MAMQIPFWLLSLLVSGVALHAADSSYDVIIRNGTIYDGSGGNPFTGDVAIRGDKIVAIGNLAGAKAKVEIDARGLAVAPGFINMLSWATDSLIEDGRSQSDLRQGVTLEVMGEGESMGPLSVKMKKALRDAQGDIKYKVAWTTLGEYLEFLVASRRLLQRRLVLRRDDGAHSRNRLRRPAADAPGIGAHEKAGAAGDGRRRDGRGLRADLHAGLLRQDGRVDRAGQSRRRI
jgi:hypothetical protein